MAKYTTKHVKETNSVVLYKGNRIVDVCLVSDLNDNCVVKTSNYVAWFNCVEPSQVEHLV